MEIFTKSFIKQETFDGKFISKDDHTYHQQPFNQDSDSQEIHTQSSATTFDKITDYLKNFLNHQTQGTNVETSFSSSAQSSQEKQKSSLNFASSQIQKLLTLIANYFPISEQKKISEPQHINQNIAEALKKMQETQKEQIEKKILSSSKFLKVNSFSQNLIIHSLKHSRHYEIIEMQIQLLSYKTSVCILNQVGNNPLPSLLNVHQVGAFGKVYLLQVLKEPIAIKVIHLNTKETQSKPFEKISSQIKKVLTEYFFILLFSQTRIGPQAKVISGFNLIMYEDSIMFATEICSVLSSNKKDLQILKESLFQIHMLKVVHRDIKPFNIMYSKSFAKNVFIDFGCSQPIEQSLGFKRKSHFAGTTAYCSDEVKNLIDGKPEFVDLYFNDIYGLKKSMQEFNFHANRSQTTQINQLECPLMQMLAMKFFLYFSKWKNFKGIWKIVHRNCNDKDLQDIQMDILRFFPEVDNLDQLKQFYQYEIDEDIRNLKQFNEIHFIFNSYNKPEYLMEFCEFKDKKQQFQKFIEMYQTLKAQCRESDDQQKKYRMIVASKNQIEEVIENIKNQIFDYENNPSNQKNLSILPEQQKFQKILKYFFAVANYSSLNQNKYDASGQQKVEACTNIFKLFEIYLPGKIQQLKNIENFQNQKQHQISNFHYFYIRHIVKKLPISNISKQMYQSVLTLSIMNYPTHSYRQFNWLLNQMFENQQPIGPEISQENVQEFIEYAVKFWEMQMIRLFFGNMLNLNDQDDKIKFEQETTKLEIKLIESMGNFNFKNQRDIPQLLSISREFAKKLFFLSKDCKGQKIIENLISRLMSETLLKQIEKCQKSLQLHTILCRFVLVYYIKYSTGPNYPCLKMIKKSSLFNYQTRNQVVILMVFSKMLEKNQKDSQKKVINKINSFLDINDFKQIFYLESMLRLALQAKDYAKLKQFCNKFLKGKINFCSDIQSIHAVNQIMKVFFVTFIIYLMKIQKQKESFSFELNQLLLYHTLMQIGYDYLLQKKSLNAIFTINHNLATVNQIELQFRKIKQLKVIYQNLIKLGNLWSQFINLVKKFHPHKNINLLYSEAHIKLSMALQQGWPKINILKSLFQFIEQNPKAITIIQKSKRLTCDFIQFFMNNCKQTQDYAITCLLISGFYQNIEIQPSITKNIDFYHDFYHVDEHLAFYFLFQPDNCQTTQNYDKLHQIYSICLMKNSLEDFFFYVNTKFIFSFVMVMIKKAQPYSLIFDFLKRYCLLFRNHSFQKHLEPFCLNIRNLSMMRIFPPNISFNTVEFAQSICEVIHTLDPVQDCYMSIIFRYLNNYPKMPDKVLKKFVAFMLKSIDYLDNFAKRVIKSDIHQHVYKAFYFGQKQQSFYKRYIHPTKDILQIPKSQNNHKIHRKHLWAHLIMARQQQHQTDSFKQIMSLFLLKETYFKKFKYPDFIRQILLKKMKRFSQVKKPQTYLLQNYDSQSLRFSID